MAPTLSGPAERIKLVIDSFPAQLARTQRFTLGVPFGGYLAALAVLRRPAAHEQIAGNMLLLQRDFLREALGLRAGCSQ